MFWMDKMTLYCVEMDQMQGKENFFLRCRTLWEKEKANRKKIYMGSLACV